MIRWEKQFVFKISLSSGRRDATRGPDNDWFRPRRLRHDPLHHCNEERLEDIFASAVSPEAIAPAIDQVSGLLPQRHHLRPKEPEDFKIPRPEDTEGTGRGEPHICADACEYRFGLAVGRWGSRKRLLER